MAYSTKVGSFNKTGAVASQAVTGVGFQPKALLLWTSYQAAGSFSPNWSLSYMVSDGTTSFGHSSVMNHHTGPAAPGPYGSTRIAAGLTVVGETGGGTPTVLCDASLTSFDADGFTLNWSTNDGVAVPVFYLAIGGTDLTAAKVLRWTPNGRLGRQSVVGMGFRPSAVMFLPGFTSAALPQNSSVSCHHAIGVGISPEEQWAFFGWAKGTGGRPSYTSRYQRKDRCIAAPVDVLIGPSDSFFDGVDRTFQADAAFVSRDLDGFTVDWKQGSAFPEICYAFGLQGGRYRAATFLKHQGSQTQTITGLLFQPAFVLVGGDGRHEDTADQTTPVVESKVTLGVSDGALGQACVSMHDLDGAGRSLGATMPINARYASTSLVAKIFEADTTPASSVVSADGSVTALAVDGLTFQWANADSLRRQLCYLAGAAYPTAGACSGGGAAPTVTNPAADATLATSTKPILFVELALDGGTKRYAAVPLADPSTFYGGFKEGRLLSVGAISRQMSDMNGAYTVGGTTIELDDTDRAIRTLEAAGTLMNRRVDVYAIDDIDRRLALPPDARRLGSFVIRRWKANGDLSFHLELEDWFGSGLSEYSTGKMIPQRVFSTAIFSNLPADLAGKPEPIIYGSASDEVNGTDAVGVVPLYFTGQETVNAFLWDRYVVCGHAIKSIQSWFATDLGNNPTGVARRAKMPASTEGVDFLIPGNAGWVTHTGSANTYRDYSGQRYTVIFARGPRSDAARSGQVPMALNVCGIEDVGDGSGVMIDRLPRQILHALTNFVSQNYLTGAWLSVPAANGYSQLANVVQVGTSAAARVGGGYIGAFILGGNGGQITVSEFIRRACISCDVNIGINRHGQVLVSMEDASVATVATFTDVLDIDQGTLDVDVGFDDLANSLPYRYAQNYLPATASGETVAAWGVDTSVSSGAALTAHLQPKPAPVSELFFVRATATGDSVVAFQLARRTGSAPQYRGPVVTTKALPLTGTAVDIGDNILVTHYAGLGGTGFTLQKFRVLGVTILPDTWTVQLRCLKI